MTRDLLMMALSLVISAVFGISLLRVVTVVETADKILRLLTFLYREYRRRESLHRKCPSSSAKRNGRLRDRRR